MSHSMSNPEWHPIASAPRDGTFFLAWDGTGPSGLRVVNWPKGCYVGQWEKWKGEWHGSAIMLRFHFWRPLPPLPHICLPL